MPGWWRCNDLIDKIICHLKSVPSVRNEERQVWDRVPCRAGVDLDLDLDRHAHNLELYPKIILDSASGI